MGNSIVMAIVVVLELISIKLLWSLQAYLLKIHFIVINDESTRGKTIDAVMIVGFMVIQAAILFGIPFLLRHEMDEEEVGS